MTHDFSNVGRFLRISFSLCFLSACVGLSWWSLGETQRFASLIVGEEYSLYLAIAISFAPLVLFSAAQLTENQTLSIILIVAGFGANFVDMATNFAAFNVWFAAVVSDPARYNLFMLGQTGKTIPIWIVEIAQVVGWVVCALVTWAEESSTYVIALIGELIFELFPNAPRWLAVDSMQALINASGMAPLHERMNERPEEERSRTPRRETNREEPEVVYYSSNPRSRRSN